MNPTTINPVVTTSFDTAFVLLSLAIAIVGSFVALTAANRIKQANGQINRTNAMAAGLALGGVGVWSMHFIGMLALDMDVGRSYGLVETLSSLLVVVFATSAALGYAAKEPKAAGRLIVGGVALGLSVAVMHYLGMAGMNIYGYVIWDYSLVALSVVIAVVAATAALWLAFNSSDLTRRVGAAVVMGIAVCAMHYTGMLAADFICTTANRNAIPQSLGAISSFGLPRLVLAVSLMVVVMLSIHQFLEYTKERSSVRRSGQRT